MPQLVKKEENTALLVAILSKQVKNRAFPFIRFGNPDVLKISNSIRSVVEFTLYELRACFISFHSHAEKFFS